MISFEARSRSCNLEAASAAARRDMGEAPRAHLVRAGVGAGAGAGAGVRVRARARVRVKG